jgi:hypothetical protein
MNILARQAQRVVREAQERGASEYFQKVVARAALNKFRDS